jgi:hypothetical protein
MAFKYFMTYLEKHIFSLCKKWCLKICKEFGVECKKFYLLPAKHPNMGEAEEGEIGISLKSNKTKKFYSLDVLQRTIAHEVAHLCADEDESEVVHTPEWTEAYQEILKWSLKNLY